MSWRIRIVWLTLLIAAASGYGCQSTAASRSEPSQGQWSSIWQWPRLDKVDLLLMIDNSPSMADKQIVLADAIPNLVSRLVAPRCVSTADRTTFAGSRADPNGSESDNYGCPADSEPELRPVTDLHIGVISSSLGSFGGDVCPDSGRLNDHGHLLNAVKGGGEVAAAKPSSFLAWFPSNEANADASLHPRPVTPSTDVAQLTSDFQALVIGVDQTGCGFEAQLESWYHFLVAPDPWVKISVDSQGLADFGTDVDTDLLQQRADFLRPDSLVAIVSLSDEDDSGVDPQAFGGKGWAFSANRFPGSNTLREDGKTTTAPRATSTCKTNPGSPDCTSCGFAATCDPSKPDCQKIVNDPDCQKNGGYYGPTEDPLDVRFHRMKERYGIDPQYPIRRYVDGLTKFKVADRLHEHAISGAPGSRSIGGYAPVTTCTNPLFAAKLPRNAGEELCALQPGMRTADLVFFAHIGGVPNQLLHFKAGDPEASRITNDDWNKILGRDPLNYNYDLISPYMIESIAPRDGLSPPSATRGDNGNDSINGREWDTGGDDLQFACTFDLPSRRTCAANDASCDCGKTTNPPLCGTTAGQQVKAKAYPTIRELEVVRALGDNGIAASLCPIQLTDRGAPDYGYEPAVAAIVDHLKPALGSECLPFQLSSDTPCVVTAVLGRQDDNCASHGLASAPPEVANAAVTRVAGDLGPDPAQRVCVLPQQSVARGDTCRTSNVSGWCYVENDPIAGKSPAGFCPQALVLTRGATQSGAALFSVECYVKASLAAGDPAP